MMKRYAGALLAIFLLIGQITLITHQLDLSAHKAGDVCHICLHASPLDNLGVASLDISLDVNQLHVEPLASQVTFISYPHSAPQARGPPALFV